MSLPSAFSHIPVVDTKGDSTSGLLLYIHVPFCIRKCNYCAFHSIQMDQIHFAWYLKNLLSEIELWGSRLKKPKLATVYFGGGTPSLIPPFQLQLIMDSLRKHFTFTRSMEITIEANPDSANDAYYFKTLISMGINRLSLGVQSLDDKNLITLGRPHSARQAGEAFYMAREAGFNNISLDFMWGLPRQKLKDWDNELKAAVKLKPEHISSYGLTIEDGTVFGNQQGSVDLELPDDDDQAKMFIYGAEFLERSGYLQYEISNFARMGFNARHNQGYWEGKDYLGLGPSAVSTIGKRRFKNPESLEEYEKNIEAKTVGNDYESIGLEEEIEELVMLSLRTSRGLNLAKYKKMAQKDLLVEKSQVISALHKNNLIKISGGYLRLTKNGMLVSNAIVENLAF